jgi:hypothetical protein
VSPAAVDFDVYMKKINEPAGDTGFPVYQCRLPVSRKTNEYCRRLPPGQIVVIVLAVLRHDQRIASSVASARERFA